ncbi:hypothetical protein IAT40_002738 [Kwoniella sp. CBS 6097]
MPRITTPPIRRRLNPAPALTAYLQETFSYVIPTPDIPKQRRSKGQTRRPGQTDIAVIVNHGSHIKIELDEDYLDHLISEYDKTVNEQAVEEKLKVIGTAYKLATSEGRGGWYMNAEVAVQFLLYGHPFKVTDIALTATTANDGTSESRHFKEHFDLFDKNSWTFPGYSGFLNNEEAHTWMKGLDNAEVHTVQKDDSIHFLRAMADHPAGEDHPRWPKTPLQQFTIHENTRIGSKGGVADLFFGDYGSKQAYITVEIKKDTVVPWASFEELEQHLRRRGRSDIWYVKTPVKSPPPVQPGKHLLEGAGTNTANKKAKIDRKGKGKAVEGTAKQDAEMRRKEDSSAKTNEVQSKREVSSSEQGGKKETFHPSVAASFLSELPGDWEEILIQVFSCMSIAKVNLAVIITGESTMIVEYTKSRALKVSRPINHNLDGCTLPELLLALLLGKARSLKTLGGSKGWWPTPVKSDAKPTAEGTSVSEAREPGPSAAAAAVGSQPESSTAHQAGQPGPSTVASRSTGPPKSSAAGQSSSKRKAGGGKGKKARR